MTRWLSAIQVGLGFQSLLVAATRSATGDITGWGVLDAVPESDTRAYFAMLRTDYKFQIQEEVGRIYYSIDMRVDPCRDLVQAGGLGEECCFDTNVAGCQHHDIIEAGPDLQIAFFQNAHIPRCTGTIFEGDPNCGTYIEVHRKDEVDVLADVPIDLEAFPNGYRTTRVATHRLCLGEHELWWVVRTRSGPYVQARRAFNVSLPSCVAPQGSVRAPTEYLPGPRIP